MSTHFLWWFLVLANFIAYYLYSYAEIRSKNITVYYLGRAIVALAHIVILLGFGIKAFLLFLPFSFIIIPFVVGLVVDTGDKELHENKKRLALKKNAPKKEAGDIVEESKSEEYIGTEISIEEACDQGLVDEYPDNEKLRLLGFSVEDLDNGVVGFDSIEDEVIRTLKEVSLSSELKESEFIVYIGIYNQYLWVGIPYIVPDDEEEEIVENIFIKRFNKQFEDQFIIESSSYPHVPLMAAYKYERGKISQYGGPEQLGEYRIDEETGIRIIFRLIMPNISQTRYL